MAVIDDCRQLLAQIFEDELVTARYLLDEIIPYRHIPNQLKRSGSLSWMSGTPEKFVTAENRRTHQFMLVIKISHDGKPAGLEAAEIAIIETVEATYALLDKNGSAYRTDLWTHITFSEPATAPPTPTDLRPARLARIPFSIHLM
jgi:hypothetical protein